MSEPVIAREVAESMVALWAARLDVDEPPSAHVLRAIMSGRLDYSDAGFRLRLSAPVELDSGAKLDEVTIREPSGRELRETSRSNRDEMDTTLRLLAELSGQPLGVVERIKMRDLTVLGELLGFFG